MVEDIGLASEGTTDSELHEDTSSDNIADDIHTAIEAFITAVSVLLLATKHLLIHEQTLPLCLEHYC